MGIASSCEKLHQSTTERRLRAASESGAGRRRDYCFWRFDRINCGSIAGSPLVFWGDLFAWAARGLRPVTAYLFSYPGRRLAALTPWWAG
jgi:hypothetical protein